MAEILGVVASGVAVGQLASRVTSTIIKLKGYWEQVRGAPDDISQLLLEIDSLNFILCHIENDQSRMTVSDSLSGNVCIDQSLKLCKQGADELSGLVVELAEKIEGKTGWRKKAGAAKVVLRKEEIKRLKRRMKYAVQLLSLAYQCHIHAIVQRQPEIIIARLSSKMSSMISVSSISQDAASKVQDPSESTSGYQNPTEKAGEETGRSQTGSIVRRQYLYWASSPSWIRFILGSLQYRSVHETRRYKERLEIRGRYYCPTWLSYQAWDASALHQSYSGWKFHLQSYRVLPHDHDIFNFAKEGNIAGLQHVLGTGNGCVTNVDIYYKRTPLQIATEASQLEACKLLLDAGADPCAVDLFGWSVLRGLGRFKPETPEQETMTVDLCRLLITNGAVDFDLLVDRYGWLEWFHGSTSLFTFLQQQIYTTHQGLSMKDRLETLNSINCLHPKSDELFMLALGNISFTEEVLACKDSWGRTLLHWIGYFSSQMADPRVSPTLAPALRHSSQITAWSVSLASRWNTLRREVIAAGSPLHSVDEGDMTPLCTHLCLGHLGIHLTCWWEEDVGLMSHLENKLYTWLLDLQESGIDLQRYGEQEMSLDVIYKINIRLGRPREEGEDFHITGLSYGPQPKDWHFWFSEPTDRFAGEFWTMIENLEGLENLQLPIPGSWTE